MVVTDMYCNCLVEEEEEGGEGKETNRKRDGECRGSPGDGEILSPPPPKLSRQSHDALNSK